MKQNKKISGLRRLQTDLGSELAKSNDIRDIAARYGYILETTAAESLFQNTIVEHLHQTLGNMMHSMLTGVELRNTFGADALPHAMYVKNRLPLQAITITPFEKLKGTKPNISHLCVFGSNVIGKSPGHNPGKFNKHITTGIFLRYGGHDHNVIFYDIKTCQTRSAQHLDFNSSNYYDSQHPLYAQKLCDIYNTQVEQQTEERELQQQSVLPNITPTTNANNDNIFL